VRRSPPAAAQRRNGRHKGNTSIFVAPLRRCGRNFVFVIFLSFYFLLAGCHQSSAKEVQGYIEGRYTYISALVPGILKKVLVERGSEVKKGQQLFQLDLMPEIAMYQSTQAEYLQTIAEHDAMARNIQFLRTMLTRHEKLYLARVEQKAIFDRSQTDYDNAVIRLQAAQARIDAIKAKLASSKWTVQQKIVYSPVNARVFDVYYRVGEYLTVDQSVLSLLVPKDIKLIFYLSEYELSLLHLGDQVKVHLDQIKTLYFATVNFISPQAEYVPPVLFSKETNAKLVYRVEAVFKQQEAVKLHPGQPVRVEYRFHD